MKSYLALAWKELKAQKITGILILVAVIIITIVTISDLSVYWRTAVR